MVWLKYGQRRLGLQGGQQVDIREYFRESKVANLMDIGKVSMSKEWSKVVSVEV